ncbi:hypothetical protein ACOJCM_13290 [Billgrantia sp. LNSP4103-1]|uniref:hypothetical protein n=1 Tax=Billgrantia sp. LNSP4103-1 TaxID=3410266 RepID=UPI00403F1A4C
MAKTPWIPAAAALTLALLLTGCGDNGDEANAPAQDDEPAAESAPANGTEPEVEATEEEPATPPPAEEDEPTTEDESISAGAEGEAALGSGDEAELESETLGESPVDTLEEGGALPGEPTRDDIEAILEDTERRFEEAQRRIDQQFEEAEQRGPELEPMESSSELDLRLEPMESGEDATASDIEREAERTGEVTQSDVDAWLEETERRFEEAQRELDEQFQEAEQSEPGGDAPRVETEDEQ